MSPWILLGEFPEIFQNSYFSENLWMSVVVLVSVDVKGITEVRTWPEKTLRPGRNFVPCRNCFDNTCLTLPKKCLYSELFWSECGKIQTRISPNTDTFYAVLCSAVRGENWNQVNLPKGWKYETSQTRWFKRAFLR